MIRLITDFFDARKLRVRVRVLEDALIEARGLVGGAKDAADAAHAMLTEPGTADFPKPVEKLDAWAVKEAYTQLGGAMQALQNADERLELTERWIKRTAEGAESRGFQESI